MDLTLALFGIAPAAFCIWLTVRIINRRERWAKWTAAVLFSSSIVYPLIFGPACWLAGCGLAPMKVTRAVFWPLVQIAFYRPGTPLEWYAELFSDNPNIVNNLAVAEHAPGDSVFNLEELIEEFPATVNTPAAKPDGTSETN